MKKATIALFILCMFGTIFAQETVRIGIEPQILKAGEEAVLTATFVIPDSMHAVLQEDYLFLEPEENPYFSYEKTVYSQGKIVEGETYFYRDVTLTRKIKVKEDAAAGEQTLKVNTGWQYCTESGSCNPPQEEEHLLTVTVETAGAKGNFWKYLLFAFLGGIILNVMPCVLPVLSIKAMHIVGQSQQNKKQIMTGSLAYSAGILVSFLVLALVVAIFKYTGESVGWGFQFQSFGFTMTLAAIIYVFALSLFDVFIINAPGMQVAYKASSHEGHWGSFLSGVFAVLLATPCTAPMLGPALGFAFRLPSALIFVFFLLIGLGLALPFILLAFFPSVIKSLPKPGNWMNTFKEFMGFLLMGTVVFLLRTVYQLVGGGLAFLNVLWFFLFLSLAAWIYGTFGKPHFSRLKQWLAFVLAVIIIIASAYGFLGQGKESAKADISVPPGWEKFTPEKVEQIVNSNTPLFLDFGAEWCMTCKTNEKTVLYTDEIMDAFKAKNVMLLKGDNTKKDVVIAQWLTKYNRAGVPLYLLYRPGEQDPVVFPEIITKGMIIKELEKIGENK